MICSNKNFVHMCIFTSGLSQLFPVCSLFYLDHDCKGQLLSKANCQALDSSKKRTKTRRILVKTNSFVHVLEESSA